MSPIEYAVSGRGPAVLVVHGAGGGYDQVLELGAPLVARGFRVVAMSSFGYLRTPLPGDASAAAQADAHACLLHALGIARAAVIGVSAGAPSSMQLALRHPHRVGALVLLVPATWAPRPGAAPPLLTPPATRRLFDTALRSDFLLWAATRLARDTVVSSILATPPEVVDRADAGEAARVQQVLDRLLPISARRAGLVNDAAVTSSLPRYDLERIAAPTLAIGVEDDRFGTWDGARHAAENIAGARFVGYARGGHLRVGHQADVEREIGQFLEGHARGGAAD